MKLCLILLFVSLSAFAFGAVEMETNIDSLEGRTRLKNGYVFGVGFNQASYALNQSFRGETKEFQDEDYRLYGLSTYFGHDWLWKGSYVTGLRVETHFANPLKRYDKNKDNSTSRLGGAINGGNLSGRLGKVFGIKTKNPILEDYSRLLGEVFLEAGFGVGSSDLSMNYSHSSPSVQEYYKIRVKENFKTRVLSGGFNLTASNGMNLELKFIQMFVMNNTVNIEEESLVNGQTPNETKLRLDDPSSSPIYLFTVTTGYHW